MAEVRQQQGIKVVFLVANTTTSGDQERLEREHGETGDIVQCGVEVITQFSLRGTKYYVYRMATDCWATRSCVDTCGPMTTVPR